MGSEVSGLEVSGYRVLVSGFMFHVSCFWFLTSGFEVSDGVLAFVFEITGRAPVLTPKCPSASSALVFWYRGGDLRIRV